jgi:hypothetical protein
MEDIGDEKLINENMTDGMQRLGIGLVCPTGIGAICLKQHGPCSILVFGHCGFSAFLPVILGIIQPRGVCYRRLV